MKKLSLSLCVLLAVSVMFTGCSFLKADKMEIAPLQEQPEQAEAPAVEDSGNKFAELIKSYEGFYSDDISWHFGGKYLDIKASDDVVDVVFTELGSAPSSRSAEICLSFELDKLDSNTLSSEFRDSWGNSGINKNKIEDGIYFPREILLQHYI